MSDPFEAANEELKLRELRKQFGYFAAGKIGYLTLGLSALSFFASIANFRLAYLALWGSRSTLLLGLIQVLVSSYQLFKERSSLHAIDIVIAIGLVVLSCFFLIFVMAAMTSV